MEVLGALAATATTTRTGGMLERMWCILQHHVLFELCGVSIGVAEHLPGRVMLTLLHCACRSFSAVTTL
jgi:hypothetical protein